MKKVLTQQTLPMDYEIFPFGATQLVWYLDELKPKQTITPQAVPFVKWAGGKRNLVNCVLSAAPAKFERYIEPFVGGGAVALALAHKPMLLNDANTELIDVYRAVRDDLDTLLTLLDGHQRRHTAAYYYEQRAQQPALLTPIERAARFMYLNKTCFNGLYRVNKHGEFNVPFGKYTNPVLYDPKNMKVASHVLQGAELYAQDYYTFLKDHVRAGDFVYLDPPYVPIGQYSDFKRYTKEQFRVGDQCKLATLYCELVALGAYPVLSNSYSDLTLSLYAQHSIQIVYAKRNINHDGAGRGAVREILVTPRS